MTAQNSDPGTTQITVRLPNELVAWLDGEIIDGTITSRAVGVTRALRRAKRRQETDADLAKYLAIAALPPDEDEQSRLDWMANRQIPALDESVTAE